MKRRTCSAYLAASLISALTVHFTVLPSQAAIPNQGMQAPKGARNALIRATQEALNLPNENRIQALSAQGAEGYRNLVAIIFDEKMTMETRWRAVMAAGRIGGKESLPEMERALKRPEWFLRNAGLLAMAAIDRKTAMPWAQSLLSDKALVVRAAAVDVIAEIGDEKSSEMLWRKLNAKENFKNGQSLFIRRKIVEALAKMEGAGTEGKFVAVLGDKDSSLYLPAIEGLERITQQKLGTAKEPIHFKREHWQRWWKDQAQNSSASSKAKM